MKTTQRNGKAAFTLIELMAVITIIVILAGLVIGGLGFVSEKQARSKAQVQIQLLSKALEEYKLDMGAYPPAATTAGTGNSAIGLYQALFKDGYDYTTPATPPTSWTKATRIYLTDLDPRTSKQGWVDTVTTTTPPATTTVKDPWGNEYRYRTGKSATGVANSSAMNPDFDLWSIGKDGLTNTDLKHKDCRDDVRNF